MATSGKSHGARTFCLTIDAIGPRRSSGTTGAANAADRELRDLFMPCGEACYPLRMTNSTPRWPRRRLLGLLIALLAMVSQVAAASVIWPDDTAQSRIAALAALSVTCHGGKPATPAHAPAHRVPDPPLCPPAAAFAVPLAVPTSDPTLPARRRPLALRLGTPPPPRAPPGRAPEAAFPRGPPTLA